MQLTVGTLVLLAAVFHATWNALVKSSGDRLLTQTVIIGVGSLAGLVALPFVPVPAPASWPFLALSIVIHFAYHLSLVTAYRHGDLSHVYPIARGTAPLVVAALAAGLAGEGLTVPEIVGVLVVSCGIASLAADRQLTRKALFYALITGGCISAYSFVDAIGARRSEHVAGYIAWLFFLEGLPLLLVVALRRGADAGTFLRQNWRSGVYGGVIAWTGYAIVIWALSRSGMAHVVALRETSVVLAALLGATMLRESVGPRRIVAALLVAVGNALLNLA